VVEPKNVRISRDAWVLKFTERLSELRPHLSDKVARTLALQQYKPQEHPRDLARQYDKAQRSPAPAKKKSK